MSKQEIINYLEVIVSRKEYKSAWWDIEEASNYNCNDAYQLGLTDGEIYLAEALLKAIENDKG